MNRFRPGPRLADTAPPDRRGAEPFRRYPCDDYFADGWADRGFEEWLTIGQEELLITQIVVRSSAVEETLPGAGTGPPEPLLRIGGPGVDGLDFVYRREHPGLWIYAPIGKTLVQAAASVTDLTDRYADGRLSL